MKLRLWLTRYRRNQINFVFFVMSTILIHLTCTTEGEVVTVTQQSMIVWEDTDGRSGQTKKTLVTRGQKWFETREPPVQVSYQDDPTWERDVVLYVVQECWQFGFFYTYGISDDHVKLGCTVPPHTQMVLTSTQCRTLCQGQNYNFSFFYHSSFFLSLWHGEKSTRLGYTGFLGELEHLKIKTGLINENLPSVMGEYVFLKW